MVKTIHARSTVILISFLSLALTGCSGSSERTLAPTLTQELPPTITATKFTPAQEMEVTSTPEGMNEGSPTVAEQMGEEKAIKADVVSVTVSGSAHQYQFSVGISSPDTGCEQFADWWEVLTEDGELIYRRILLHSHVNEQPFTRSGGPVDIEENSVVYVRAHMNQAGYGGSTMKGSVDSGFVIMEMPLDLAPGADNQQPLPTGCEF